MAFAEPEDPQGQIVVFPTMKFQEATEQTTAATPTEEAGDNTGSSPAAPEVETELRVEVHTEEPKIVEPKTSAPMPPRGDGPNNIPKVR